MSAGVADERFSPGGGQDDELEALRRLRDEGMLRRTTQTQLIETAVLATTEKSLAMLRALAQRPEEWLSVDEIVEAMSQGGQAPADVRSIGGVLGAFARQAKRLGMRRRLFDVRYDHARQRYEYRMDGHVAAVVIELDPGISDMSSS